MSVSGDMAVGQRIGNAAPAARYGRPVAVKLTKYELEKMFKRA